jgi:hypothetical protein
MTKERPEIVIEGSDDGRAWQEYELHWKPGNLSTRPRFCEPHQPRLDWEMWFAAVDPRRHMPTVLRTMSRILEGSPDVLSFFAVNPFPEAPPKYLRAIVYDYHFTDPETRATTGAWWTRENPRPFVRPMMRPTPTDETSRPTG